MLGYSDNHLSTFFSASIRSRQAFWPTVSASGRSEGSDEEEWNIERDLGRANRCRIAVYKLLRLYSMWIDVHLIKE